jgi:hypothetical protein
MRNDNNGSMVCSLSLTFPRLSRVATAQRRHLMSDGFVSALLVASAALAILGVA